MYIWILDLPYIPDSAANHLFNIPTWVVYWHLKTSTSKTKLMLFSGQTPHHSASLVSTSILFFWLLGTETWSPP